MDGLSRYTLQFLDGTTAHIDAASFLEFASTVIRTYSPKQGPVFITGPDDDKYYYFGRALAFYSMGSLTFEELKDATWCDGLYRNTAKLFTSDNHVIDPGSLWLKRDNRLLLVDEDEHIECEFNTNENRFTKIA